MTIDETIREGLVLVGHETEFRGWLNTHGLFDALSIVGDPPFYWQYSLADLAFRARDMAGDKWMQGIDEVYLNVTELDYSAFGWACNKATHYHWIIAGIVALEMGKETSCTCRPKWDEDPACICGTGVHCPKHCEIELGKEKKEHGN